MVVRLRVTKSLQNALQFTFPLHSLGIVVLFVSLWDRWQPETLAANSSLALVGRDLGENESKAASGKQSLTRENKDIK